MVIAGELTSKHEPNYRRLVYDVFKRIGFEKLGYYDRLYAGPDIQILVKQQSPDIALGVDKGGAGDQGMMYGYATNETVELLPIPFMVATKFLEILKSHPSKMFRADAKAQVSFDYDSGKITTFLCSVQHSPDIMALHADPSTPASIDAWLDQFEMFSIYEVLPEILELWGSNLFTDVKSAKN